MASKQSDISVLSEISLDEVFKEYKSSALGLSSHEVVKRIEEHGKNVLSSKKEFNVVLEFFSHFLNPLILILIFAAVLSFIMGEIKDAGIIACIVIFGVVLDFFQEYSADKALKKLLDSVKTTSSVLRNGKKHEVKLSDIVPGDIILLSAGDMVPADSRVIESKDFFVNQSAVTGESFPSEKVSSSKSSVGASLSELSNIVFSGTNVVSGSASAIVLKTGKYTEFGKIASKLAHAPVKSDFEKGISSFGIFIMKIILLIVVFIFFVNSFLKHNYFQSFMFAIAIAVGVTPELLPMIMSITMAVGSKRMSKHGVIVKRLSSIPNFGGMNVLCTDKTGTLTENKIALVEYTDYRGESKESILKLAFINSSFQTGLKNPLDEAVLRYRKIDITGITKIDEIPYDFFRKKMSIIAGIRKNQVLITKGAPENILKSCRYIMNSGKKVKLSRKLHEDAVKTYHNLSSQGYRVLAISTKEVSLKKVYSKSEESDMVFEGFVSFLDPPKKDVKSVIRQLKNLGVETKIITGDNEFVTKKICSEVELEVSGVLLGSDIARMSDDALKVKVQNTVIFARCSPDEKNRIIAALRAAGNVVGYLGDGINDAPSLKTADVSISVDSAVDIAKESADIVLTKKSLGDLKNGILEGRKTFGNTMKYVMMTLSSNFGNMFSATGAVLFLPFLPMLPVQILLNNLIYDVSQITIPSDNVDDDWIQKPKRWNLAFVKKFMYVFGPLSSLFDYALFFILFFVLNVSASVFQTSWFIQSLATQTLVVHIIRTKKLPFIKSRASFLLFVSSMFCLLVGVVLPYTPIGSLFNFEPLPFNILLIILAITVAYLLVVEFVKRIFYKKMDF